MSAFEIGFRDIFSRMGRGMRGISDAPRGERIFRIGNEMISLREVLAIHRVQDGERGAISSLRRWVSTHCDPLSYETVAQALTRLPLETGWLPVVSEESRCLAGFQGYSRETCTDYPVTHETRDWNWFQVPDPTFTYLLNDAVTGLSDGFALTPWVESEWEGGSFPLQWRPFWGEYVTIHGRHIYDVGHAGARPEIHPAHTIIREHTTAAPAGADGATVPVNRAIVGMGLSGGFPRPLPGSGVNLADRWALEFGGLPQGISGDTEQCWATNLERHPVSVRMFPPVPRPSDTARLQFRVVLCEFIACPDWPTVDAFLELCQYDDPAEGGKQLAFRRWDREAGLPDGFAPEVCPPALHPLATVARDHQGRDVHLDVRVDLAGKVAGIAVGYYAVVECGWDEKGPHELRQYRVLFESITAIETDDYWWDDWHVYYGVNGQWADWYTDDFVESGGTYTQNREFIVWTVDDLPILIRDTGVEWDGTDAFNESLDRVELTIPGPDHLDAVAALPGVSVLERSGNRTRFVALGTVAGDTTHSWVITLEQLS